MLVLKSLKKIIASNKKITWPNINLNKCSMMKLKKKKN